MALVEVLSNLRDKRFSIILEVGRNVRAHDMRSAVPLCEAFLDIGMLDHGVGVTGTSTAFGMGGGHLTSPFSSVENMFLRKAVRWSTGTRKFPDMSPTVCQS